MYRYLTSRVLPMPEGATLPPFHMPWCFGCGTENEQGLGLEARIEGDKVVSDLQFAPWFAGGPGLVHGGAIGAFFDDLMGFVPMAHLTPAVTAKLEINYRRPIPLGTTVRGEAWLSDRDGRKLWAEAVGTDGSGEIYVETRSLFLAVGFEHFAKALEDMPEEQRERLARFRHDEYYP